MKKTKIICTMGPNTDNKEVMRELAVHGMDIARFNFSHGDHEEQKKRLKILKAVRDELGLSIAALLDTKGPEIRTGILKDGKKVLLKEGERFILTTREIEGDEKQVSITYKGLVQDIQAGNRVLIDDGLIELEVEEKNETDIVCIIKNGGELGSKKGVNIPNVKVNLPAITEKDREDIIFGVEQGFDFIAASFVRNADCIREIKAVLHEHNADIPVIAKIENAEGIENIDEIIHVSDGIMVARGDMGVEIPAQDVPFIQKMIIKKCNDTYKPVITATQMLDSMMRNPRPTRAEVTDVANAIYDGSDAVMLSGETSIGRYPVETLKMMVQIAESTEEHLDYDRFRDHTKMHRKKNISSAVSFSSVATAENLNAAVIITPTMSGSTARLVSKFRPKAIQVGISPNKAVLRKMQLYWGVKPLRSMPEETTDCLLYTSFSLVNF